MPDRGRPVAEEDDPTPAYMFGIRGRVVDLVAKLAEEPAQLRLAP